jgi:hypothetical protein
MFGIKNVLIYYSLMDGLPGGIRSRYNASTFKNKGEWSDLYGNKNAQNVEAGHSKVVPKKDFHETGHGGISKANGFPYVEGASNSRWNLTERFKDRNWTVAYIIRYDPRGGPHARILDIRNSNTLFGHWSGRIGVSHHEGWVKDANSLGHKTQWIFAIEQPKRHLVRGGINTEWNDKKDGSVEM